MHCFCNVTSVDHTIKQMLLNKLFKKYSDYGLHISARALPFSKVADVWKN